MQLGKYHLNLDISAWSRAVYVSVILAFGFLSLLCGYWLIIQSQQVKFHSLAMKETQLKNNIEQARNIENDLTTYQNYLSVLQQRLAMLDQKLPNKNTESLLMAKIFDLEHQAGVSLIEFKTAVTDNEQTTSSLIDTLNIQLVLSGSYFALANFISSLIALENIVKINDFTITPNNDHEVGEIYSTQAHEALEMKLDLIAFYKNDNSFPVTTFKKYDFEQPPADVLLALPDFILFQPETYQLDNSRSPFQLLNSATVNTTLPALQQYPLTSLKMVGTVQEKQQSWALILLPNNTVQRVTIGQILGKNHGQVINITSNKVIVAEPTSAGDTITHQIKLGD